MLTGLQRYGWRGTLLFLFLLASGPAGAQQGPLPAFPGAEGFGAFTIGGRGGDVYIVTNLLDYESGEAPIEGSLRHAVQAEGPRTILFRVSGIIDLKRILEIKQPFVTIAGQTAPGDGVVLRNFGISIEAPEVILRHLRVRPGDVSGLESDAINVRSDNVIIDHCSASWATDETVSVIGDATNVTIQWCLIAESLNRSVHSKGEHGYGSLISTAGDVSIHHTVYAFHKSRNPRPKDALLDFRNNLVYGFGDRAGYNVNDFTRMNYVANYVYPLDYSNNAGYAFIVGGTNTRLFLAGNVLRRGDKMLRDDWKMIRPPDGLSKSDAPDVLGVPLPFAAPSVRTHTAEEVFGLLVDHAGATRPARDGADRRTIDLIRSGGGRIIDSQQDVGGWPELAGGDLPRDADTDGMPDGWERDNGLDPLDGSDHRSDLDRDGYTNLEEYLNETDPRRPFAWMPPPAISPASGTVFADSSLVVRIHPPEPEVPVHYTLDGTEPNEDSPRYTEPIHIHDRAHIRAVAVVPGMQTTAAFADYRRMDWLEAADPANPQPGVRFALYRSGDWDEEVDFASLEVVRSGISPCIAFDLRPGTGEDALVFEGYIRIPRDGVYSFFLRDDARSRLLIGGEMVTAGRGEGAGQVPLRAGMHRFLLRSLHEEPRPSSLMWSGPEFEEQPIPPKALYHESP